jgi:nicotinamidase/pyrazinamidase
MALYDPQTALVVVDVQNDFADPGGSLYVRGGEQVVPLVNHEIERARQAGATVVYTQDWHPPSTPHFEKDGGIWPVHCVQGTWGAEFHPDLHVEGEVVRKGMGAKDGYSGFTVRDPTTGEEEPTALERILRDAGVSRIVLAGLATDYCVRETAIDGRARDFGVTVLLETVRAVDLEPGDGQRALEDVQRAGANVASIGG